jgi:hypothetical protein
VATARNGVNFERWRIAADEEVAIFTNYVMIVHQRVFVVDGYLRIDGVLRVVQQE